MRDRSPRAEKAAEARLIEEWQQPIYNLARRLLADPADAADATQETFTKVLEKMDGYRSARNAKAWLYRVAVNAIRDFARRREGVRRRESVVAHRNGRRSIGGETALDDLQRRELQRAVQRQLADLPERDRVPLVLFYYNDLSIDEVGVILDTPRSTVHARMRRGIRELRGRLRGLGYAACTPALDVGVLEELMRSTPPHSVPGRLSGSLAQLTGASSPTTAAALSLGGIIMKKLSIGMIIVSLVSLVTGVGLGHVAFSGAEPAGENPSQSPADLARGLDYKKLLQDFQALQQRWNDSEQEKRELRKQLETARAQVAPATGSESPAEPTLANAVDWAQLSDLFSTHWALLKESPEYSDEDLPLEDQANLAKIWEEWETAGEIARTHATYPFLDDELLPKILRVAIGDTLGFSEGQMASLTAAALSLLDDGRFPGEDTTPLTAHQHRMEIIDEIEAQVPQLLDSRQREEWPAVQARIRTLLSGQQRIQVFGIERVPRLKNGVLRTWKEAYGLEPNQEAAVEPLVDRFVEQSQELLRRYGQLGDQRKDLRGEEDRRFDRELLQLGIALERDILPHLSAEQRASFRGAMPYLLQVRGGRMRIEGWSGRKGF